MISNNRIDRTDKYQFHFEEKQFMDKFDKEINLWKFLDSNPDINRFFKNKMDNMLKYLNFEEFEIDHNPKYPDIYFYCKGKVVLMEWKKEQKYLYVNHEKIWSVYESVYLYNQSKIKQIIKNIAEHQLKLKGATPVSFIEAYLVQRRKNNY